MSDLITLDPRDLYHAPHLMGETVHRIEKVIEAAAALERWEDLDRAIDFLVACQKVILQWWTDNVREGGRPSNKPSHDHKKVSGKDAQRQIGFDDSRLSRWRVAHSDLGAYREKVATAARRKAELEAAPNRVTPNSGENEWFTPAQYVEAARAVMGGIDLDPASHPMAQETVQATHFYTRQDNGLSLSWHGRVWLNPPYSQPLIGQFADKLAAEVAGGAVEQAIMLTNNCTDTAWFHKAEKPAALLCFTRGRINFYGPSGIGEAPLQGQAFFYYGDRKEEFRRVFGAFGFVR